jgi:hypothetical protein
MVTPPTTAPTMVEVVIAAGWPVEAEDMIALAVPPTVVTLVLPDDVAEGEFGGV